MQPPDGLGDPHRHVIRERPGFHKIADQQPVFHAGIPDPRRDTGLRRRLLAGKLVCWIAYYLFALITLHIRV